MEKLWLNNESVFLCNRLLNCVLATIVNLIYLIIFIDKSDLQLTFFNDNNC